MDRNSLYVMHRREGRCSARLDRREGAERRYHLSGGDTGLSPNASRPSCVQNSHRVPLNCTQLLFAWMLKSPPAGTMNDVVFSVATHVW